MGAKRGGYDERETRFFAARRLVLGALTAARTRIFLHNFLGEPLRAKGFAHRQLAGGWGVLTHNLWVLARLPQRKAKAQDAAAA